MNNEELLKKIIAHCKEYGFIFPSSEIYDGLSAVYDYGQNGVELKNNIKEYWWKSMVQLHENIVGIDSAIFMHPRIWEASGHVSAFNDPLIDNKDSKKRYRADQLIEEHLQKIEDKIQKEIEKASKRFGDKFDEKFFKDTNPNIQKLLNEFQSLKKRYLKALQNEDLKELRQIIIDNNIVCQISGTCNWTDVRKFNLMFQTQLGAVSDEATFVYLRPETAQGIFVNFLNILKTGRMKIPFGIAQIGKAFRNEIVARQWIMRMREFEQMEMQYFVKPGTELEWFQCWKEKRMKWHKSLNMGDEKYRFHDHDKLAHYANAATDIEYLFPMGFKEIEGIHSRTDYDLKNHEKYSGKKIQYFDSETNESYTPYVIETSIGLDRMFFSIIAYAYTQEKVDWEGSAKEERVVLKIPVPLAPVKLAILPLTKKDELPDKAKKIFNELKYEFNCQYEEKDSIGRRYRRQDAIGTPYCITIDHQTLEDDTVTIRDRDSLKQQRIAIRQISDIVKEKTSLISLLKKL